MCLRVGLTGLIRSKEHACKRVLFVLDGNLRILNVDIERVTTKESGLCSKLERLESNFREVIKG